jgi:K(+)-stimulated pyrophosphate-energized sodium pump
MPIGLTGFEQTGLWAVLATAIVALLYAAFLARQILRENKGSGKMLEVAESIRQGANAYLKKQFRAIIYLIAVLAVFLYLTAALAGQRLPISAGRAAAFLMGSLFSASVGYLGMNMAVQGNMRVASAANRSFSEALRIAYRSGTITGMLTDGLGLLGGTVIFLIYFNEAPEVLLGFGFGGTLLALFMRVGGGIYTKAADVGADLVGKIEAGIPEDDPRNAAVVADLVGDNVGDCAGMAADIFESYEVTIVSAMLLGLGIIRYGNDLLATGIQPGFPVDYRWIVFPLLVRGIGVLSSIIGTYAVSWWPTKGDAFRAMDLSYDLSSAISVTSFALLAYFYVQDMRVFCVTTAGILLAISFNKFTNYFTSPSKLPVRQVARSSKTGAATLLLGGLSLGFESTVWAIMIIAMTIFASIVIFAGNPVFVLYGVSLVGVGMLTQTGNNLAMDAFGPIADNASGIGEMSGMGPSARKIMADLDAAGNTTKAITKGIAIASAVLAAVSLFGSFVETITRERGLDIGQFTLDIANPSVFTGMLIGGAIPFLFSSLTIKAVGRAASKIVEEVREQFHTPGVMEGRVRPDYARVVSICTTAAQRELISLALLAVLPPMIVGFILAEGALGGFLAGSILTGQLLAVFMANAGGAWDNAKKSIEDGLYGGKGSEPHKASIIGDTVGDPLKDTSGPALNPMIKVINLVSLLVAPLIVRFSGTLTAIMFGGILAIVVAFAIYYSKKETMLEVLEVKRLEQPIRGPE